MNARPDVIDWGVATRVGRMVARPGPDTTRETREAVWRDFQRFTGEADLLVREFTGLQPPDPAPDPLVVDRAGWIDANVDGVRDIVRPLIERLEDKVTALGPARRVASTALGAQVGVLLGYLSQKVLGQYDLVLASEGGGRVYYVGPNVIEAESRWNLDPEDFRLWITLHEITHRTQFTAVPWLRERMRAMIEKSLSTIDLDPERVRRIVEQGRRLLLGGPAAWRSVNVMDLLLSDEQRELVGEIQALMSVVEGHGTFVMNRIGRERIPSFGRMNEAIHARRGEARGAERAFQRAIGLEMKMQQYRVGERFMEDVAERAGLDAVNKVWISEAHLPTLDEMHDPDAWLHRVGV